MRISPSFNVTVTGQGSATRPTARVLSWLVALSFLVTSVLGPVSVSAAADETVLPASTVVPAPVVSSPYVSNRSTGTWYRVPTIIKNAQGALLVFAERRNNATGSDYGDFDIVVRKSSDGGRTWGSIKTVANDGRNKVSSPVAVLDPRTGTVLVIYIVRRTDGLYLGHFIKRSTDGGNTWSAASRLGPQRAWTGRPGPGHAIVLTKGAHAGRILIAMGGSHDVHGVYSDDGGRTWNSGFAQADPAGTDLVEATVSELPSGALFIAYRDNNSDTPGTSKRYAYSYDGGATLAARLAPLSGVRTPSVQGSSLNPVGSHSGELLFSGPSYTSSRYPTKRRDMAIFVSKDGGATWGRPYPVNLESTAASYSDLVQIDDATLGIAYETGRITWLERISFRTIRMTELTNPTKVASSVSVSLPSRTVTTAQRAKVNVDVTVKGILRPLGRISVTYTSPALSGTVSASLSYTNLGERQLILPTLRKGTYAISVTYLGAFRISGKTVSGGLLRVR